jgi:GH35 family endo-1,4-beta-xylanase
MKRGKDGEYFTRAAAAALAFVLALTAFTVIGTGTAKAAGAPQTIEVDFTSAVDNSKIRASNGWAAYTPAPKPGEWGESGSAIYVESRTSNWHGVDIVLGGYGIEAGDSVVFTINGFVESGETVEAGESVVFQSDAGSNTIYALPSSCAVGQAFEITGSGTVDDGAAVLRIQTTGGLFSFYIGYIRIEVNGGGAGSPPPSATAHTITFNTGDYDSFRAQSGSPTITKVTGQTWEGAVGGCALSVTDRTVSWDAVDFPFAKLGFVVGDEVKIEVAGFIPAGADVGDAQINVGTNNTYAWVSGSGDLTPGSVFTISTSSYTISGDSDTAFRVQSYSSGGSAVPSFMIGYIKFALAGEEFAPVEGGGGTPVNEEVYRNAFEDAGALGKAAANGDAVLSVEDKTAAGSDDNKMARVSGQAAGQNYHCLVLPLEQFSPAPAAGDEYQVTVKLYAESGVSGDWLAQTNKWNWLGAQPAITPDTLQTLTFDFVYSAAYAEAGVTGIQITTKDGISADYFVDDILVVRTKAGDGAVPEEQEPGYQEGAPFAVIDFEGGGAAADYGFEPKDGAALSLTTAQNHTAGGGKAMLVETDKKYAGAYIDMKQYITTGGKYEFSFWAKSLTPDAVGLNISAAAVVGDPGAATMIPSWTITAGSNGWTRIQGQLTFKDPAKGLFIMIQNWTADGTAVQFAVDDVTFTELAVYHPDLSLASIKDTYAGYFDVGVAIDGDGIADKDLLDLIKRHFNVVTPENEMKPASLFTAGASSMAGVTYTAADRLIQAAVNNGMLVHGHTLIWHSQSAPWLNSKVENGTLKAIDAATARANMDAYISGVISHFNQINSSGQKLVSYDVVNEAFSDQKTEAGVAPGSDWRRYLRGDGEALSGAAVSNQSPFWYLSIGPTYIEEAFLKMYEADPSIKRCYNDYNLDYPDKALAVASMVKDINARYKTQLNGANLIETVGMQGHYTTKTSIANVENSIKLFINAGVDVAITELDVTIGDWNDAYTRTEAELIEQGRAYANLFNVFKKYAARIDRVTIWGTTDGTSWRGKALPLLFDANFAAKPAYYAVTDPDKFLRDHPESGAEEELEEPAPPPLLPAPAFNAPEAQTLPQDGAQDAKKAAAVAVAGIPGAEISGEPVIVKNVTKPAPVSIGGPAWEATTYALLTARGELVPVPTYKNPVTGKLKILAPSNGTFIPLKIERAFSDVKTGDWFEAAVNEAAKSMLLVNGGALFNPAEKVTMAETVKMFENSIGLSPDAAGAGAQWYAGAVAAARRIGMINADADPEAPVTRADAAQMSAAALKSAGINVTLKADDRAKFEKAYKDVADLTDAQKNAFAVCLKYNVFVGYGDGTMRPEATSTRAEMATAALKLRAAVINALLKPQN